MTCSAPEAKSQRFFLPQRFLPRRFLPRHAALVFLAALGWGSAFAQPILPQPLPPPAREQQPPPGVTVIHRPSLRIGDCWEYRNLNVKSRANQTARCVVKILGDGYLMETAGRVTGLARYDKDLVWIGSIGADRTIRQPGRSRVPRRMNFPLWQGKTWTDTYRALDENLGSFIPFQNIYTVEGFEKIKTPAGEFTALRIKRLRKNVATGEVVQGFTWYSPRVKNIVRAWNEWPRGTKVVLTEFHLQKRESPPKQSGP